VNKNFKKSSKSGEFGSFFFPSDLAKILRQSKKHWEGREGKGSGWCLLEAIFLGFWVVVVSALRSSQLGFGMGQIAKNTQVLEYERGWW
jgi:hypothetical protein